MEQYKENYLEFHKKSFNLFIFSKQDWVYKKIEYYK